MGCPGGGVSLLSTPLYVVVYSISCSLGMYSGMSPLLCQRCNLRIEDERPGCKRSREPLVLIGLMSSINILYSLVCKSL